MEDIQSDTQLIHMLITRLERVSADSYWAYRASGVDGALLGMLGEIKNGQPVPRPNMKRLPYPGLQAVLKENSVSYSQLTHS